MYTGAETGFFDLYGVSGMASKRDIFNRALIAYGDDLITSPDDETVQAEVLRDVYDQIYDETLLSYPWSDALVRENLAADPTAPAFEYTARYRLSKNPVTLRVLQVQGSASEWYSDQLAKYGGGSIIPGQKADWLVEGGFILVNTTGALPVRSIARVSEGLLRANLANVLSANLANAVAYKRTNSNNVAERMEKRAEKIFRMARTYDAQEKARTTPAQSDILAARQ